MGIDISLTLFWGETGMHRIEGGAKVMDELGVGRLSRWTSQSCSPAHQITQEDVPTRDAR